MLQLGRGGSLRDGVPAPIPEHEQVYSASVRQTAFARLQRRMGGFAQSVPVPVPHESGVHQRKELSTQFDPPVKDTTYRSPPRPHMKGQ
ncbi:hypothetical protein PGT21_006338 [Puccinia graminis f. sp. tritici]|uniref:Uncharacterized protein n=1 Tax=Puccinia graminis f. sp. tritici TaxID=56615 RepID=A0A5B0P3P3_PUCGR|nr:hypothetical protein PGT21_006338 [Puccinia graminis f. sp. tritici]KAA1104907.1 hypothetical protein PGTUg99_009560 [Puccinia graminis f. sp. tritici]